LIKLDIINEVVNRTGITKTKAELAVETVFESMKKALATGDRIELRGFGVFNVRPRKTGIGRNPRTGAEVSIPPGQSRALQARQGVAVDRLGSRPCGRGFRLEAHMAEVRLKILKLVRLRSRQSDL
jgi:DNA-binding protein HU-beta